MILTDEVKIKATDNLTSEYIDSEFKKLNINPLRWAIVEANEAVYTISVSYENN